MFRRVVVRRIGVESDVFLSRVHNKAFVADRLTRLGKPEATLLGNKPVGTSAAALSRPVIRPADKALGASKLIADSGAKGDADGDAISGSSRRLSNDDLQRFTASNSSPEQLFNVRAGLKPTGVVGEDGREIGSAALNPTRYGDWEKHGRCYDF